MKRITFDGLFCDIAMCKAAHEDCPHGICSQRQTWERLKLLEDVLGDNYDSTACVRWFKLNGREVCSLSAWESRNLFIRRPPTLPQ